MKVVRNINDMYHLAYLRYVIWQRKKDSKLELKKIQSASNTNPLSLQQKKEISSFWNSFSKKEYFDINWFEVFNAVSHEENLLQFYLPHDFFYCYVDTLFSNTQRASVFDDKNMYDIYFHDVKMPPTICRKMGGVYLDNNYNIISIDEVITKCIDNGKLIIKETINSCGGYGISFWDSEKSTVNDLKSVIMNKDNYIVQEIIKQHEEIAKLHKYSVNTIRIMTLLYNDEIIPVSSVIRMGVDNSQVDNAKNGGLVCGLRNNGQLREVAYDIVNNPYLQHPQGTLFPEVIIPSFDKCIEISCRLAGRFASVAKLISWDFAVDVDSNPVLIEANFTYGGIGVHQKCNGPLFGDKTAEVIKYVFANHPFLK